MPDKKTIRINFISSAYAQESKIVIGKKYISLEETLPSYLERFKELASYKSVVMEHKTWNLLGQNKFLPYSQNIIITKKPGGVMANISERDLNHTHRIAIADSFEEALMLAWSKEVLVIGEAEIYATALPVANFIHHTMIDEKFEGGSFFPDCNWDKDWEKIHSENFNPGEKKTQKDKFRSWYLVFERKHKIP